MSAPSANNVTVELWPHAACGLPGHQHAKGLLVVPCASTIQTPVYQHLACTPDTASYKSCGNEERNSEAKLGSHGEGLLLTEVCLSSRSVCPRFSN